MIFLIWFYLILLVVILLLAVVEWGIVRQTLFIQFLALFSVLFSITVVLIATW